MTQAPSSASSEQPVDRLAESIFPSRKLLLHIGFHKTGTTALQSALASARPQLEARGISYPGQLDHQSRAALAVLDRVRWQSRGGVRMDPRYWQQLLREVRRAERVVVSSEFFSVAEAEKVKRVVDDLGPAQVHVVATVRSFDRILPSAWQQFVKGGMRHTYDKWLRGVLADPASTSRVFWRQHDHPGILQRWADVVGPAHVTLVVLDEADRSMMFRAFEQMLDLPAGLLADQPRSRENRSFTAAEAEMVRRVNQELLAAGVTWPAYGKVIRYGAVNRLLESRTPGPDEQPILTPRWASVRAAEIGAQQAAQIRQSGINVVGDLDSLARPGAHRGDPKAVPDTVPVQVGVEALLGAFYAAAAEGAFVEPDQPAETVTIRARREVRDLRPRDVVEIVYGRLRRRLTGGAGHRG